MDVTPKDASHHLGGTLMSLATATLRRGRRLAVASLVAAAALSLTACRSGDDKASAAPSAVSSQAASDGGSTAGDSTSGGASGGSSTGSSSTGGEQAGGGSGAGAGKGASRTGTNGGQASATGGSGGQGGASAGRKGVNGTWVGKLNWLTEYKLSVAPESGPEQAFHLLDSTKVLGAAALCEAPDGRVHLDSSGYGTAPCTLDDARKAAKLGSVDVRVTVKDGVATKIAEHYRP
ncbi:hypothetical protein [Streptomyces sp. NRRL S-1813]|uniref:hypothetical protein n=1 Tax=Streptomyces sp. NRRL S-1813 TaxID=1463888 RepID=UPI00068EBAAD|nr:hypothetical protein [Streptomyces sp. NRRL S-1813]